MDKELRVVLTQTFERKPLATVRNFPGGDADLTPVELRTLAAALIAAADECEQRPMDRRNYSKNERAYPM